MISLIIPTTTSNKKYTDNVYRNIRQMYPDESKVEVIIQEDDSVTLGVNYNNAVAKAKGEKIILLHNDMVLGSGFIELMDQHISKGRITTYTRVEPPIYNDTYPGKVLLDCGTDLESFNENKFKSYTAIKSDLVNGGSQLFFGCYREDYIGIDGHTFTKFCEDDDLHLRYRLLGFEHKVSPAYVYHFVSKTSRVGNFNDIEMQSNKNFIRKWGFRNSQHNIKYDIGFVVTNCSLHLLEILEPWCSTIYLKDDYNLIVSDYIAKEQSNTRFNLRERIKPYDSEKQNEILISFAIHLS